MQTAAEKLGLPLLQPNTVNSDAFRADAAALRPELLVVCDYGEILKPQTLSVAESGGVNLHGSLLPKYRGAAPVQWALLNGDAETGNTVIQMTPGLDAGPILGVQRVAIEADETAGELEQRLAELGGELVVQVVDQLETGAAAPQPQDAGAASKAPRLTKEHGQVDWSRTAGQIRDQIRALQPWPRAFTYWRPAGGDPVRLILLRGSVAEAGAEPPNSAAGVSQPEPAAEPGRVLDADRRLVVATGQGALSIDRLQPAGRRAVSAEEFLRGRQVQVGDLLAGE